MGLLACGMIGLLVGFAADYMAPTDERRGIFIPIVLGVAGGVLGGVVAARLGWGSVYYFDLRNVSMGAAVALAFMVFYRQLTEGERVWPDQTPN
jgi:uncharacterized membrane protein YeaQ/YmgE (transglycosylase-associated protein family)